MIASLNAIVPMACVAAAGIAAMIAEAFTSPGERMPIAPLGIIGLLGAALAVGALWDHNATSFGVVAADNFGLFVTGILVVVGMLSLAISAPAIDREGLPRGEWNNFPRLFGPEFRAADHGHHYQQRLEHESADNPSSDGVVRVFFGSRGEEFLIHALVADEQEHGRQQEPHGSRQADIA